MGTEQQGVQVHTFGQDLGEQIILLTKKKRQQDGPQGLNTEETTGLRAPAGNYCTREGVLPPPTGIECDPLCARYSREPWRWGGQGVGTKGEAGLAWAPPPT